MHCFHYLCMSNYFGFCIAFKCFITIHSYVLCVSLLPVQALKCIAIFNVSLVINIDFLMTSFHIHNNSLYYISSTNKMPGISYLVKYQHFIIFAILITCVHASLIILYFAIAKILDYICIIPYHNRTL